MVVMKEPCQPTTTALLARAGRAAKRPAALMDTSVASLQQRHKYSCFQGPVLGQEQGTCCSHRRLPPALPTVTTACLRVLFCCQQPPQVCPASPCRPHHDHAAAAVAVEPERVHGITAAPGTAATQVSIEEVGREEGKQTAVAAAVAAAAVGRRGGG